MTPPYSPRSCRLTVILCTPPQVWDPPSITSDKKNMPTRAVNQDTGRDHILLTRMLYGIDWSHLKRATRSLNDGEIEMRALADLGNCSAHTSNTIHFSNCSPHSTQQLSRTLPVPIERCVCTQHHACNI